MATWGPSPDDVYIDADQDQDHGEDALLNPLPPAASVSTSTSASASTLLQSIKIPTWYDFSELPSYRRFDLLVSLKRLGYTLIPSWITTPSATMPSKSGISALDGLRGLACVFVFNEHYVIYYQSRETQAWFMRVPFIRLIFYGKAAVFLFFVISGYVLSYKPLKLIRARSYLDFQKSISSSFVRRAMRLYLPCMMVSFIACVMTSVGMFERSAAVYDELESFLFLKVAPPPHLSLYEQWEGYLKNLDFIFSATIPFDRDTDVNSYFVYNPHQWTIPKEFRSSMVIFAVLVTTSRMRSLFRMATVAALGYYALCTHRLYTSLFFIGMFCAECDQIRLAYYSRQRDTLPEYLNEKFKHSGITALLHLPDVAYKTMWITLFILGVFMISSPQEIQQTPNYLPLLLREWGVEDIDNTLLLIGGMLVVWSVAACPSLGPLFNNPLVAYLGKISYALYLVHGVVIKSVGLRILPATLRLATWTPNSFDLDLKWWLTVPGAQKVIAYLMGVCCVGTTCFWLADLFWRFVDVPSVSFARTVEGWITQGADDPVDGDVGPAALNAAPATSTETYRRRAASMAANSFRNASLYASPPAAQEATPKRKNG